MGQPCAYAASANSSCATLPGCVRLAMFLCFVILSWQVQALPWEIDCLMARMTLTYDAATDVYSFLASNARMHVRVILCV